MHRSPLSRRAAVVIRDGDETFVDLGGTRLAPIQLEQIREAAGGRIDLLCVQGAAASWYPSCYEYTDERRREAARQKRLARFAYIVRAIRILKPAHVMPFGAHPCFLDPELFHHNDGLEPGGFPDQKQYIAWLAWVPNLIVAELFIATLRKPRRPKVAPTLTPA